MLIDTHAHLDGPEFKEDLNSVLSRAKQANIEKILIPAINLEGMTNLLNICKEHEDYLVPMIGLHPEEVKEDYKNQLDRLHEILVEYRNDKSNKQQFCAIGEVGLDYYWDDTYKSQQIEAFEQQIQWAIEFNLPLMIHVRNAHHDLIELMEKYRKYNLRGVFHCFSGTAEEARQLLSFPYFMLGIGGVVTFKKSTLPEVLKQEVPLSRIVLETDAPYLAPVPHRGKRNESSFIVSTATRLSEIYECEIDNIATQTKKNTQKCLL